MKTKIIYISGGEIFNMSDVRNAFDTVRHELGLSKDTILFGVPVDAEDALGGQFESVQETVVENIPVVDEVQPEVAEPVVEVVKPEKPKRTRKKAVVEQEIAKEEETEQPIDETDKKEVIPILSVLGGEKAETKPEVDTDTPDVIVDEVPDVPTTDTVIDISVVSNNVLDDDDDLIVKTEGTLSVTNVEKDIPTVETQTTTIQDTDDDDENALEKLLESVKSLHEEKEEPVPDLQVIDSTPDETDATLEKLATEFAENQDKIVNTTKSTARGGRIGKLKNILPFKKSKRTDSGLMGDLFGWAGVAANDEEFAIPEFFPTAVKK